ncbi:MAG: hypothetical protein LBQ62_01715 [Candidatus Accumulibacter sp.]|jgi:hypothetical protein|nr:hypothetical protein [Accumulibacter sp.]
MAGAPKPIRRRIESVIKAPNRQIGDDIDPQGQEGRLGRLYAQAPFHPERHLQIGTALTEELLSCQVVVKPS